jgi:hypothetical protein
MSMQDITQAVMELPERERLELARLIVASLAPEAEDDAIEAVQRIEDMASGKVRGLSEVEFRDALK